jgi:hypothetical protein
MLLSVTKSLDEKKQLFKEALESNLSTEIIHKLVYKMNIYFKVVEVQIQTLGYITKLGRDSSHPCAVLIAPHPKKELGIECEWFP